MYNSISIKLFAFILSLALFSCNSGTENTEAQEEKIALEENAAAQSETDASKDLRIVSLAGTFTETISALGFEENIVGVDVTSVYPPSINSVPKLGHITGVKAEGVAAFDPDLVFVRKEELKPELKLQLESLGIELVIIDQKFSVEGTKSMIATISKKLNNEAEGKKLIEKLDSDLSEIQPLENQPVVLFIYARGPGTLMVAGKETPLQSIINLAGGENIGLDFTDFKPLTSEALVSSNPDVILLFSSGKESLDASIGMMAVPGVAETTAGKKQNFLSMDGLFLAGFGPRLGAAAQELNQKLKQVEQ